MNLLLRFQIGTELEYQGKLFTVVEYTPCRWVGTCEFKNEGGSFCGEKYIHIKVRNSIEKYIHCPVDVARTYRIKTSYLTKHYRRLNLEIEKRQTE